MILYQSIIVRADVRANPDVLYVFGDNMAQKGMGGQAREIRGERNALGIPTKHSPSVYFQDRDLSTVAPVIADKIGRLRLHLDRNRIVVFPIDGIGTGLTSLPSHAPRIWAFLCAQLEGIGIRNHG